MVPVLPSDPTAAKGQLRFSALWHQANAASGERGHLVWPCPPSFHLPLVCACKKKHPRAARDVRASRRRLKQSLLLKRRQKAMTAAWWYFSPDRPSEWTWVVLTSETPQTRLCSTLGRATETARPGHTAGTRGLCPGT